MSSSSCSTSKWTPTSMRCTRSGGHADRRPRRRWWSAAVRSGKSVIALSLLGELSRQGRTVMHATGSRSFTMTLRKVAGASARGAEPVHLLQQLHAGRAERHGLPHPRRGPPDPGDLGVAVDSSRGPHRPAPNELLLPPTSRCSSSTSTRWCGRGNKARSRDISAVRTGPGKHVDD